MGGQLSEDWLERLRARDHEAFNQFVRLYHAAAFRLAQRLLRHADDAQEVTQDAFLAAYEGIAGFEQRASPRTWLLAITYRKALDRLKRRASEGHLLSGVLDDDALWKIAQRVEHLTDWGENPEHHFSRAEFTERLNSALGRLPAESRAVFELRDVQGLSTLEAAQVLGMSEGALRVRLHRVRQYLMSELQSLFGGKGVQP